MSPGLETDRPILTDELRKTQAKNLERCWFADSQQIGLLKRSGYLLKVFRNPPWIGQQA